MDSSHVCNCSSREWNTLLWLLQEPTDTWHTHTDKDTWKEKKKDLKKKQGSYTSALSCSKSLTQKLIFTASQKISLLIAYWHPIFIDPCCRSISVPSADLMGNSKFMFSFSFRHIATVLMNWSLLKFPEALMYRWSHQNCISWFFCRESS